MSSVLHRILVIQNDELGPLGLLADALDGHEILTVDPAQQPLPDLAGHDGLIVLGGRASALDDDETGGPLTAVRDYLRAAVDADVPVLGVCLGAQLLATAMGGRVERDAPAGPERGLIELRLRPEAAEDPIFAPIQAELPRDILAPSSHADVVSVLPEDAVWLASSRQYPFQAFRIGSAWGVQFHPEVDRDTLEDWMIRFDGDQEAVRAGYRTHGAQLDRLATLLGQGFAAQVSSAVRPAR